MSAIRILPLLVSAICFGTLAGCNDDPNSPGPDPGTEITKVNPAGTNESLIVQMPIRDSNGSGDSMFTEMTPEETGVVFTNLLNPKNLRKYLLNGAGLCTGDYDNDGLVDMYLVCQDGPNKLYRQVSDWKFEDVTESAGGLDGSDYWGRGATFADIENDGDLDLYLCNANGPNQL